MAISVSCSACGTTLKVGDNLAGKKCKCPKCAKVVPVPAPEPDDRAAEANGDEDRPRKKKSKKGDKPQATGGKGLLLAAGGLVLILGLCVLTAGGGGLWWYLSSKGSSASTSNDPKGTDKTDNKGNSKGDTKDDTPTDPTGEALSDAYYFPTGTTSLTALRVGDFQATPFHKKRSEALASLGSGGVNVDEYNYGVPFASIDRIVKVGTTGTLDGRTPSVTVQIVQMKAPIRSADLQAKRKSTNVIKDFAYYKAGKYTIHVPKTGPKDEETERSFALVGGKTVVYGPRDTLKAIFERDQPADLSPAMKAAMDQADFKMMIVSFKDPPDGKAHDQVAGVNVIEALQFLDTRLRTGSVAAQRVCKLVYTQYDTDVTSYAVTTYKDANTAMRVKAYADVEIADAKKIEPQIRQMGGFPLEFKASINGNTVTLEQKTNGTLAIKQETGR